MNDKESFEPLEERLADEAQRLLADSPRSLPLTGLRAELARRRRRRTMVGALSAAAVVAVALIATVWMFRPAVNNQHVATEGGGKKPDEPSMTDDDLPRGSAATDFPDLNSDDGVPPLAISILMSRPGSDGETELVPAWYVPGHVVEVDAQDLSPAERSAMSQLLGLDLENSDDQTI